MDKIHIISYHSELYPPLLREIPGPPEQLYVRGDTALLNDARLLAVVGSRMVSTYTKQAVPRLLNPVVKAGVSIVSGLAYGVDSMAHRVSIENNRKTIAVLGSGIDETSIYPKKNIKLARQIIKLGGAVISEYEPGTPALPGHFPARNRIISGLCRATLIVQAAERSGSLITARHALEANREVMAVPGPITDSKAVGTNKLIRDGATPVIEAQDILDQFDITIATPTTLHQNIMLNAQENKILAQLSDEPKHIDDIQEATKISISSLSATLVKLEIYDCAEHVGGMKYVRKN
jgi:DNA processing protein